MTSVSSGLSAVILAAGKGTRMKSGRAKVLHELLGLPMVSYPILRAQEIGAAPIVVVLGHQRAEVEAALRARHGDGTLVCVEQAEQRGTGHAAGIGIAALPPSAGLVLILSGDAPLVRAPTLLGLVARARETGGLAVLTARVPDPTGYGRIVRGGGDRILRVVEHKDASDAERAVDEINSGIYCGPAAFLRDAAARLSPRNAQAELYLTDAVEMAAAAGPGAFAVEGDHRDLAGINDRRQLVEAERVLAGRLIAALSEHATFRDPAGTVVEPFVRLGADVEIGRGVALRGRTVVGDGARIDDGCVLVDTEVGAGAEVRPYTVATEARIGPRAKIGPFAHLRPGTDLGEDVHVGNFVETKKARFGRGSKANHLSYVGDAVVGARVNIGAGTITCNYNGYEKRETVIDDGAFIGSDTQLVAPVRVGARAVVAAGTTVTKDVPEGALALTRVEQKHVDGYAERVAQRYAERRAAKGK
jgi:bifunctional UDP-N-acetylglucosamine pyrophosphorylase/glucosamine-1-phosphate N-acetyltransferase